MMTYQNNRQILQNAFPEAYRIISESPSRPDAVGMRLAAGPAGCQNVTVNYTFLHDRTHPLEEARRLIDQFSNIGKHSDILFYGIGLAYHIKYFTVQYPDIPFFIYEPLPELFDLFLHYQDLSQMPLSRMKGIYLGNSPESRRQACQDIVNRVLKSILIITLPAYQKLMGGSHPAFLIEFEACLSERRNSLATNHQYQKRWTLNSITNFSRVLQSSNILMEAKGRFLNKPALLAASGPSLDQDIENLRYVKERKLAYIFTAGTALNTLIKNGVYPHAAFTYDPSEENRIVGKEAAERGIDSIPLIFASTVGSETLNQYPGPLLHLLSSQDLLSRSCLQDLAGKEIDYVNDASTISIIALQVLYRLGFNPIILVGQNLAYQDKRRYASGSTYHPATITDEELSEAVLVRDVRGNPIASNPNFVRMRQQLEYYLAAFQGLETINTAPTGAHIEYTRYLPLDEVIKQRLLEETAEDDWLPQYVCRYDLNHLEREARLFNQARREVIPLLNKCLQGLDDIQSATGDGKVPLINRTYEAFNQNMADLRGNLYIKAFIEPMNRVGLELLMLAVPGISGEKAPLLKAKMMENEFRPYLLSCQQDYHDLETPFLEMYNFIISFCRESKIRGRLENIKLLLLEDAGVLIDEYVFYSASGEELIRISRRDRAAIRELRERGIKIMLVGPGDEPGLKSLGKKLGLLNASGPKLSQTLNSALSSLDDKQVAYIGSHWYGPQQAGLRLAVQDATEQLRQEADFVLSSRGGQGAVYEFAQLLLKGLP